MALMTCLRCFPATTQATGQVLLQARPEQQNRRAAKASQKKSRRKMVRATHGGYSSNKRRSRRCSLMRVVIARQVQHSCPNSAAALPGFSQAGLEASFGCSAVGSWIDRHRGNATATAASSSAQRATTASCKVTDSTLHAVANLLVQLLRVSSLTGMPSPRAQWLHAPNCSTGCALILTL